MTIEGGLSQSQRETEDAVLLALRWKKELGDAGGLWKLENVSGFSPRASRRNADLIS